MLGFPQVIKSHKIELLIFQALKGRSNVIMEMILLVKSNESGYVKL